MNISNSNTRLDRLAPLLRSDPDNLTLHRECVELAMRGGEFARALEFVQERLSRHPSEAETQFARGSALIGLQRFADALEILKGLEAQGVTAQGVLSNIALCQFALRQYENASTYAEQLLAAGDTSPGTVRLAVSSLHYLGKMEAAVALADAHAALAEQDGGLAGVFAMAYADSNELTKAARCAAIALAHNPDSIDGLTVEATIAAAALDADKATRQFARVVELAPHNGRGWLGLGMMAFLAMDLPRAQEFLTRGLVEFPTHIGSWIALGWSDLLQGNIDSAEKHFNHALELDRNFSESHGAVAAIYAIRGDREAAERHVAIAERLDRTGLSSHYARAILMNKDGGPDAGREYIFKTMRSAAPRFGKGGDLIKSVAEAALKKMKSN